MDTVEAGRVVPCHWAYARPGPRGHLLCGSRAGRDAAAPWTRARLALRVPEREELAHGLARGKSLRQMGHRLGRAPRPSAGRCGAMAAGPAIARRWRILGVGPGPSAEAVPARGLGGPAHAGGDDTRAALVTAADRGVAQTDLPRRSGAARVARDDRPGVCSCRVGGCSNWRPLLRRPVAPATANGRPGVAEGPCHPESPDETAKDESDS